VELSSKVVDSEDRLQRTLAHELCHVAAWLLDHVSKPPHGQVNPDPFRLPLHMQPSARCTLDLPGPGTPTAQHCPTYVPRRASQCRTASRLTEHLPEACVMRLSLRVTSPPGIQAVGGGGHAALPGAGREHVPQLRDQLRLPLAVHQPWVRLRGTRSSTPRTRRLSVSS